MRRRFGRILLAAAGCVLALLLLGGQARAAETTEQLPEELIRGTNYVRYAVNDLNQDDLWELVELRRIAMALMARIHSNYRFVIGFNGTLIALGVAGVLPPATSATLHNLSTLGVSLRSMGRLTAQTQSARGNNSHNG